MNDECFRKIAQKIIEVADWDPYMCLKLKIFSSPEIKNGYCGFIFLACKLGCDKAMLDGNVRKECDPYVASNEKKNRVL